MSKTLKISHDGEYCILCKRMFPSAKEKILVLWFFVLQMLIFLLTSTLKSWPFVARSVIIVQYDSRMSCKRWTKLAEKSGMISAVICLFVLKGWCKMTATHRWRKKVWILEIPVQAQISDLCLHSCMRNEQRIHPQGCYIDFFCLFVSGYLSFSQRYGSNTQGI